MEFAIQTYELEKMFSKDTGIRNINLDIEEGKIYGFLGENGAGKTTIFKLICGLLNINNGDITVLGMDIKTQREKILNHMGILIETPVFYENLTVEENLKIHLELMNKEEMICYIPKILDIIGLAKSSQVIVKKLSLGMKQRLAIARTIIHQPKILILDEPINGLDPKGIKQIRNLIININEENNTTILISSHILNELENLADKIIIISEGKLINEVCMSKLKNEKISLENYYFEKVVGDKDE